MSAAPDGPKPLTEDEASRLARFLAAYDYKRQHASSVEALYDKLEPELR